MTGLFKSPAAGLACPLSVIFRLAGAADIAPTAAAPTAVFCRKLRLDIFDFFSSAIRFPSVRVREEDSSRPSPGGRTGAKDISTCVTTRVTKIGPDDFVGAMKTTTLDVGAGIRTPDLRMPQERRGQATAEPYESDAPPG